MNKEVKKVQFKIQGEFITQTARAWFWDDGRPWNKVEELLLSCMCGGNESTEELRNTAKKIVLGYSKFIGNTADGGVRLVDDTGEYAIEQVLSLHAKLKKAEDELEEFKQFYDDLVERIEANGSDYLLSKESDSSKNYVSPLLAGFLEAQEHEDNYGWLDPSGKFYPVEFGEHQEWAMQKVLESGWEKHMRNLNKANTAKLVDYGGYLVDFRGWVLLHNPCQGTGMPTCSAAKPMTKAQREFLFDYYTARGRDDLAVKYLEDA